MASSVHALIRASHPGPCLVITAITVLLAVAAGAPGGALTPLAVCILAGQLSIGWSNDYVDERRDTTAGRTDKPLAAGALRARTVLVAALVALGVAFATAVAIDPVTAAWLGPVVGGGWAYNAGLKATPLSGLAYVVGFAPLPGLATSVVPGHPVPQAWAMLAAALLGLGAHFANVLPDLAGDGVVGVRGLPQLVGAWGGEAAVRAVALGLLLGACVLIARAPGISPWLAVGGFLSAIVLGVVASRSRGRTPFRCVMAIAGINVALFTLGGGALT